MKRYTHTFKKKMTLVIGTTFAMMSASYAQAPSTQPQPSKTTTFEHLAAGNPYLPLWEHLPDGKPRVFEDPDRPGKFRAYIIGSHDLHLTRYCGPDIRMWSAPVEDLSSWRDEGAIFTYQIDGKWDVM